MTDKAKREMGVTFSVMGDSMTRFRDAIARDVIDYRYAALQLYHALEALGRMEKQLKAAKASDDNREDDASVVHP